MSGKASPIGSLCKRGLRKLDSQNRLNSRRKKEPKPKLFGPDIFQWGRGLPRERVGAKKFDASLEAREIKLFGRALRRGIGVGVEGVTGRDAIVAQ